MSLREFVEKLRKEKKLVEVKKEVSKKFEACNIAKVLEPKPVLFEKIKESDFQIIANPFASRELICNYLGIQTNEFLKKFGEAIDKPSKPELVKKGACQEVVEEKVDLDKLPILYHFKGDGGNYVCSGVMMVRDKELGQNCSFHRAMQLNKNKFSIRVVPRHLAEFLKRNKGEIDAAFCIGLGGAELLAGACSVELGRNELEIANSLKKLKTVKAKTIDIEIPDETEIVLEGRITENELAREGPFIDLTETADFERQQPVFEVKKITHRKKPLFHALIPGGLEHKVLMGSPREPTIYKEVNKVCNCIDIALSPGGCSWLHAWIKIDKKAQEEGKKAIEAAFKGHPSLKHAFIVDKDIDILKPEEVEWALATRFQGDKQLVIKPNEIGSSLDPSSDPTTRKTCKLGFDLTSPPDKQEKFKRTNYPKIELKKYLKE